MIAQLIKWLITLATLVTSAGTLLKVVRFAWFLLLKLFGRVPRFAFARA